MEFIEPAATEGMQPVITNGKIGSISDTVNIDKHGNHAPAEPAATGMQEGQAMNLPQTGGVYIGLHEHQNVVPAEPSTPQTTELPPLDVTAEDELYASENACCLEEANALRVLKCRERQLSAALTREREKDAEIERLKVQVGGRNIYIKSFQDSEEARMEELAALRTSRDALLKDLNTFLDMEEFLPPLPIHQCGTEAMLYKAIIAIKARNILEANRAAAQQLPEDGK